MARFSCRVRLKRFVPNLTGYTEVKSSPGVQAIIAPKARAVAAAAGASSPGGTFTVAQKRGRYDLGYVVAAENYKARLDQARSKVLTKANWSIGGK